MGQRLTNLLPRRIQRNRLRDGQEQLITELRGQPREMEQQFTNQKGEEQTSIELKAMEQQIAYLQGQEQTSIELRGQLRAMEQQITYLQRQLRTRNWVISRIEIYMETNEVLGKGAWGRVVRGKFRRCVVAVKQIHELLSPQAGVVFEKEISIASRCRHPCL